MRMPVSDPEGVGFLRAPAVAVVQPRSDD